MAQMSYTEVKSGPSRWISTAGGMPFSVHTSI